MRVSRTASGGNIDGASVTGGGALSQNGRFVAFNAEANNVVPGDTAMCPTGGTPPELPCGDVFVVDRRSSAIEMVSVSSEGEQGQGWSNLGGMSADGRLVVFGSAADNLAPGDANGRWDIFVRDRAAGVTTRISDASADVDALYPRISADGRIVAFEIYDTSTFTSEVYAHDLTTGTTVLVSATPAGQRAGTYSTMATVSGNGRFVAFRSDATNLVTRDRNGREDIFVRDLVARTTRLVSLADNGRQFDADSNYPSMSNDGNVVAFVAETSFAAGDVYVRDVAAGRTELVSVNALGLSGGGYSQPTGLSADGRYVLFASFAGGMTKSDPLLSFLKDEKYFHVYVRDRSLARNERVSVNTQGTRANRSSFVGAISPNGAVVAFSTSATNLDPTATNGDIDVYLRLMR